MVFLNTIFDNILSLVFPVKCISCGKNHEELCISCLSRAPEPTRETAQWIFPIYDYRHPPIKKALWLLKYKGRRRLANIFAENLYGKIIEELSELRMMENFRDPLLVPIPLSKNRLRDRGYNQAQLLCEKLAAIDQNKNFKLEKNILVKPVDTKSQARIENRSERLRNILGSFAAENEKLIKKRNIILIDDITTTGATLNEARKILKKAGARKIIAFTVAH